MSEIEYICNDIRNNTRFPHTSTEPLVRSSQFTIGDVRYEVDEVRGAGSEVGTQHVDVHQLD
jgi:hypothetical protein